MPPARRTFFDGAGTEVLGPGRNPLPRWLCIEDAGPGGAGPDLEPRSRPGRVLRAGRETGERRRIRSGRPAEPHRMDTANCRALSDGDPRESGPDLTVRNSAGKVERVPRGRAAGFCGWFSGVWLFFENSTGCLISQCQLKFFPGPVLVGFGFLWQQIVCCRDFLFKFLLESLILAQDERWRRA